jgi:heme iron utilization protein
MAEADESAPLPVPLPGSMPDRLPEGAPAPDFDPRPVAKALLRATRSGTLATIDSAGKGDPLAHPRLTLIGVFAPTGRDDPQASRARRRFLARHPKSELYAGFADFAFWRLDIVSAHLNAGFARAADLKAAEVMTEVAGAEDLIESEAAAIAHMNADHSEAVRLYATRLLGADDGSWRLTGLDPEGLDLARGDAMLRLPFPVRVTNAEALRKIVVVLAKEARSKG